MCRVQLYKGVHIGRGRAVRGGTVVCMNTDSTVLRTVYAIDEDVVCIRGTYTHILCRTAVHIHVVVVLKRTCCDH